MVKRPNGFVGIEDLLKGRGPVQRTDQADSLIGIDDVVAALGVGLVGLGLGLAWLPLGLIAVGLALVALAVWRL